MDKANVYIYIYIYIYIYADTYIYYSTIKKNGILPFAAIWIYSEGIMLSEVSQILYAITHTWSLKNTRN